MPQEEHDIKESSWMANEPMQSEPGFTPLGTADAKHGSCRFSASAVLATIVPESLSRDGRKDS